MNIGHERTGPEGIEDPANEGHYSNNST